MQCRLEASEAVLMAYQHIVVAVDGSASSREALERGIELARRGDELTILGIEEPWPVHAGAKSRASGNGHLDAIVADAVGHAQQAGVQAHGQVLNGYPAEVLVKFSAEHGCDLVVLGAGPRVSTWLGSTADKVVDRATCAVLVVR
jgi:nucleotide-binding universal stress UspA family protein